MPTSPADRLREAIASIVRTYLAPLDYYAFYRARIVAQHPDGTLDLTPDDDRLPSLGTVPVRIGIPATKLLVRAGTYCMVGFDGGSPQKPFATHFEHDSIDTLVIEAEAKITLKADELFLASEDGAKPIARQGDLVQLLADPATPVSGSLGGSPFAGVLTIGTVFTGIIQDSSVKTQAA